MPKIRDGFIDAYMEDEMGDFDYIDRAKTTLDKIAAMNVNNPENVPPPIAAMPNVTNQQVQMATSPHAQQAAIQALGPVKYQQLEQFGQAYQMGQANPQQQMRPQQQMVQPQQQMQPQQMANPRPEANNNWYDQILYTPASITAYNKQKADEGAVWDYQNHMANIPQNLMGDPQKMAQYLLRGPDKRSQDLGGDVLQSILLNNSKATASTDAIRNYNFREKLAEHNTPEGRARQAQFDQMRDRRLYNTGNAWQTPYGNQQPYMPIQPAPAQMPRHQANVVTAQEQARDQQQQIQQNRSNAELATKSMVITNNARKLAGDMSDMQFGYVPGMLPNITGESQALDSMLSNLIPTVIDSLGPGPKSDSDLLLLERMLPHQGMERREFLKALDRFDDTAKGLQNKYSGGQMQQPQSAYPSSWSQDKINRYKASRGIQ